jgi:hypothetical protein
MKTKVLKVLKPKTLALGFSQEELEGVAETISGNLTEESTDDDIESAVKAILPFLKVSQQAATRVINAKKEELEKKSPKEPKKGGADDDEPEEEPKWFKSYREKTEQQILSLKQERDTASRLKVFEALLEGLPEKQKTSKLKDFGRISFKDDEDFNSYIEDQKEVVKEIKLELSEHGLDSFEIPSSGKAFKEEDNFVLQMKEINKKE